MTLKSSLRQAANFVLGPLGLELIRKGTMPRGRPDVGPINDGTFWDDYVRKWEEAPENKASTYLGNEWKNEEIFLSQLTKYSSPHANALEIGCGGGRITQQAVRQFKHVYAADVSREMIRRNSESIRATNVTYHNLDGFTLSEFAAKSIDCVFSHDVFVHFSSMQVYPYFKEIKRVLKKDGIGIVSFYDFVRDFDYFKQTSLEYHRSRIFPPHMRVHFITEEMLTVMLRDVGLEVLKVDKTNYLVLVFRN